jgi:3-oxoacyl-[acyl-carrier-protein] synthase II
MTRRVVITGLGAVAPNGIGTEAFGEALFLGQSGIKEITFFDASSFPCRIAGEVADFPALDYMDFKMVKRTGRFVHLGMAAATMASQDADLKRVRERNRIGIIVGSSVNALDVIENGVMVLFQKGQKRVSPYSLLGSLPNAAAGAISIVLNIKGISLTISTGCSSAINAIGIGRKLIERGDAKLIVSVGTEAPITPSALAGFSAAGMLAKNNDAAQKASRPFDAKRTGGVLSEGAGAVVLEELGHAQKRNARIYGEVVGFGSISEGYSLADLQPDGRELARSMSLALRDGALRPSDIDYICAHAPSDPVSDIVETKAIKRVFGTTLSYRIPVSSIKSMIGNPLAAAGVLQVLACVLAMEKGSLPPTINYEHPDPLCDLDYVPNVSRRTQISTALINSHGLGSSDTTLILRRFTGD